MVMVPRGLMLQNFLLSLQTPQEMNLKKMHQRVHFILLMITIQRVIQRMILLLKLEMSGEATHNLIGVILVVLVIGHGHMNVQHLQLSHIPLQAMRRNSY